MFFKSLIAAAALVGAVGVAFAADISGAGATFPFPIYAKWADSYKKETNNGLNYQSIGSGAGIKQIRAKTVTFGATDAPLEAKDLDKDGLAQWPMVMGGIVMVINIPGVKPGELVLDGPTVAGLAPLVGHRALRAGHAGIGARGAERHRVQRAVRVDRDVGSRRSAPNTGQHQRRNPAKPGPSLDHQTPTPGSLVPCRP